MSENGSALGRLLALSPGALAPSRLSLRDEIRRLIGEHGQEAIEAELKEQTKRKRGRKPDPDWKLLRPIITTDAELWLQGEDPTGSPRTNYAIAAAVAESNPGHSAAATHRRIMRKLAKSRRFLYLATAANMTRSDYAFRQHLRALEELAELGDGIWDNVLSRARAELERYRERHGEPDPALSFAAIEGANRNALLPPSTGLAGLLGMFGNPGR